MATRMAQYSSSPPARLVQIRTWFWGFVVSLMRMGGDGNGIVGGELYHGDAAG
jgi:hypothetical protein